MRARIPAALATAAIGLALLAPSALSYGTSTAYASQSAGTPPGVWASVSAAGSAADASAAATLTETDAAGLAATQQPSNRAFSGNAIGWTPSDTSAALCTASSAYDGSLGTPAGSIRSSYATLVNLGALTAPCSSTWTSASFTWNGGTPASVAFALDRMVDVNGLGTVTASWSATLVDETVPGSKALVGGSQASDSGWVTQTASGLLASDVVSGRTYHLRLDVAFTSHLSLVTGIGLNLDNITLTVTPKDDHADGELRALSVPAGSTHTLELRARTSGESFVAQLWNGSAWTTRATISGVSPSWDLVSYGLTSAEWNGGTVRVRFLDTGTGADASADVLSVEYMRVVATGGITVSGPSSATLSPITLSGTAAQASTGSLGSVEVVDAGGLASGWSLTATATRWALDGTPGQRLPATAFSAAPSTPTTPDGSDLTGLAAGAGGVVDTTTPITLMSATSGHGVGRYRENPALSLGIPVTTLAGTYRSVVTLTVQ